MDTDNRPRIVHVVNSLDGGGTERMLVSLLREFDPSRARHVLVTLRNAGSLSARLPDHVACRPIGARQRSIRSALALARITRGLRPSVIHARNTGCWFDATFAAALTPGSRLLAGFHGLESCDPLSGRQRRRARWALHAGARFVSVSESGKQQLNLQAGIPITRIDVLPNGVDLDRFGELEPGVRKAMRASLGFDESALVIGIVGSLTPVKHHACLIRAMARMIRSTPNVRLLIVGDGPLKSWLMRLVQREDVDKHVVFTGQREDVPILLNSMDAYVCCSRSEGMNNALLEAAAVGLPIVATDVGDAATLLRHNLEACILENPTPTVLSDALVCLLHAPETRRRLSERARLRAREFNIRTAACRYEAYYRNIIGAVDRSRARHRPTRKSLLSASA